MNVALLICQVILAGLFAASGYAKSTMSRERMAVSAPAATRQTGAARFVLPVVRFAAAMKLLAAIGLILPQASAILPDMTAAAALGLCAVMIGAATAHIRLHEPQNVATDAALFALCGFVVAGRLLG